jgi:hypothetical protein
MSLYGDFKVQKDTTRFIDGIKVNDQYGRQVKRSDYTSHGYGNQGKPAEYHSNPHTHTYEYGPGYGSNGKVTRTNND